ncbi:hypothetical protein TWF730_007822 [Orbilia blumenaviensis]|uniref:Uncharacterized protein n=1 Tax=Orbilia blumenaviensis TaxID=1796055 RepID=A0AAV9VBU6_9PEZI
MPPRKRLNSGREMSHTVSQSIVPEQSHKKRHWDLVDAPSLSRSQEAGSIKMDQNSVHKPLRRSARLQQAASIPEHSEQQQNHTTISTPKRFQRPRSKTVPTQPRDLKISKRKPISEEEVITPPKRRRRKSTSARRDQIPSLLPAISFEGEGLGSEESEVRDPDGVLWIKMPITSPQDIYNFSAEFYISPPRTVEVNTNVGPPPIIVRLHIVEKNTGQEVPYDKDAERYYWAMARVLHGNHAPCTEPEYQNKNQATETPMSWFHEEQEEDTRTPVTHTPPPGGPVRKWKTFVTFPNIQIPVLGEHRIKITLGVYIDQKLRTEDGRERFEKVCMELVSTTSEIIVVQEEEPKDDDASDLLEKKELYDKFLAERDEFFRREQSS